jgi:cytochrome oxidase assembly protein ShyY1
VLVLLVGFGLAAGMVLMGIWQLRVYQNQGAEAAARRAAEPAVPLSAVAPAGGAVRDGYGRSVTFAGTYDPAHQRLLTVDGVTDRFRVVTLLRTDDGAGVVVVRGVATDTGSTPPAGRQEEVGVLLPSEEPDQVGPEDDPVRVPELAQTWPGPLVDGFVILSAGDAESQGLEPATIRLPEGRGRLRNGAYAMQWWLFAGFAVVMAIRMARDLHAGSMRGASGAGRVDEPHELST